MAGDNLQARTTERDLRLYLPHAEDWTAEIKKGAEKEYCFHKQQDEDRFHLLVKGEVYLQHGKSKYCLNCAIQLGIATDDRLFWQHRVPQQGGQSAL